MNKILDDLKIKYEQNEEGISFLIHNHQVFYNFCTKKVYLKPEYFGKIPHVMPDGSICISANQEISFEEGDESTKFKNTVEVYIPYLLSLTPALKLSEMIGEVDFYIRHLLKFKSVTKHINYMNNIKKEIVYTPNDLWDAIYYQQVESYIEIQPDGLEQYSIIIYRKTDNKFCIDMKEYLKTCQRVVGNHFAIKDIRVGFIGVGSVNSYIIKELVSQGVNKFSFADNDIVEQGNMMRFAFPIIGDYKVDAARKFVNSVTKPYGKIQSLREMITKDSKNYFDNCVEIYISVDNYQSWLDILLYLGKYSIFENRVIHLVGIDAFANYSKYISINTIDPKSFYSYYISFLTHKVREVKRKEMVLNGCGKSLAIYNETQLINLASKATKQSELNTNEVYDFRNSN